MAKTTNVSKLFFACTVSLLTQSVRAEQVKAITFNTGLLKIGAGTTNTKVGLDGVGCVSSRFAAQKKEFKRIFDQSEASGMPVILALQEIWSQRHQNAIADLAKKSGMNATAYPGAGTGVMTISSAPIIEEQFVPYPCDKLELFNHRGILITKLRLKESDVYVFNTHTAYSTSSEPLECQLNQFKFLAKTLNEYSVKGPVILMGDLNAGPNLTFKGQKYDPAEKLWKPFYSAVQSKYSALRPYSNTGEVAITWSDRNAHSSGNPLVVNTTVPIALTNVPTSGAPGAWEENSSQLDHILFSKSSIKPVGPARLIFNDPIDLASCKAKNGGLNNNGRFFDAQGKSRLSDHYGVKAILDITKSR